MQGGHRLYQPRDMSITARMRSRNITQAGIEHTWIAGSALLGLFIVA